jgi:hypothetical protein
MIQLSAKGKGKRLGKRRRLKKKQTNATPAVS